MLGKYNWTIANDHKRCHEESGVLNGEGYKTELKLSGCKQGFKFDFWGKMHLDNDGEFTCNDGQCVNMSDRSAISILPFGPFGWKSVVNQ